MLNKQDQEQSSYVMAAINLDPSTGHFSIFISIRRLDAPYLVIERNTYSNIRYSSTVPYPVTLEN